MGKKRCAYGVLVGILREGDNLENIDVDGRIKLKWIFKKCRGVGPDWYGPVLEQMGGICECGKEHLVFIKCGDFFDWLRTC